MSALPHPRYPDPNAALFMRLQWYGGSFIWMFIYAACGFAGPALFKRRVAAIVTSALITIAMATLGTVGLVYLACAVGNDCL